MGCIIPFIFPAHVLWLSAPCETVIVIEHGLEGLFVLWTEEGGEHLRLVAVDIVNVKAVDVPCHVHKCLMPNTIYQRTLKNGQCFH